MDVRKIGTLNKNSKTTYITLPQDWGNDDEFVKIEIINERELKLIKIE